jgi:hypothetical protein
MSCVEMKENVFFFFFEGVGGWLSAVGGVCLDVGGRKRRNRGGEGQWSSHILTITDAITGGIYPSVYLGLNLTVILSVKLSIKTFTSSHCFVF